MDGGDGGGTPGGSLDAQLLVELEACEISDADVYVPFLRAMLDDADPLAEDETKAREALQGMSAWSHLCRLALIPYLPAVAKTQAMSDLSPHLAGVRSYVADGVADGIAARPLDDEQVERLWQQWRSEAHAAAPTALGARSAPASCSTAVDITDVENAKAAGPSKAGPPLAAAAASKQQQQQQQDDDAAALRAQTIVLAQRVQQGGGSQSLPVVDNHSAVRAAVRAEVAQVRAARTLRKEEAKSARQEREREEERKRNHRLNISAAKEKQETLRRETARQRVKAEKDASIRRKSALENS